MFLLVSRHRENCLSKYVEWNVQQRRVEVGAGRDSARKDNKLSSSNFESIRRQYVDSPIQSRLISHICALLDKYRRDTIMIPT